MMDAKIGAKTPDHYIKSDVHRNGGLHVKGKNSSPGVKLIWLLVLSF